MSILGRLLGKSWLRLVGFRLEVAEPLPARCVLVAGPHTSNWDLPLALACAWITELPFHWLAKHTIFRPPFGWVFRAWGGIAVDRRESHHMVDDLVALIRAQDRIALTMAPKGTRSARDYWKSGFYHVALAANVPVCLAYVDYGRKAVGLGPVIALTGDVRADMDEIRAFYEDIRGKYPELEHEPRLREEDAAPTPQEQRVGYTPQCAKRSASQDGGRETP